MSNQDPWETTTSRPAQYPSGYSEQQPRSNNGWGDLRERVARLEERISSIERDVHAILDATTERAKAHTHILQRLFQVETEHKHVLERDVRRREHTKNLITYGTPGAALLLTGSWDKALALLRALIGH